jgi:hypothetical protein
MIIFRVGGEQYEYDPDSITVGELRELKRWGGLGLNSFARGLGEGDPDALVGMLYLAKRRAGIACRWQDFDTVDLATFEVVSDDAAGDADADPPASPSGSDDGTTSTD